MTVREHVLRTALQTAYANGSDEGKKFVEDLSADGIGMVPNLFLGQPDFNCDGATNLLVAILPMWGQTTVTVAGVSHLVDMIGEIELTLTPVFKKGPANTEKESSVVLDQFTTEINARRWVATVTSPATPPDIAALITGDVFRDRFGHKFSQGVFIGRVTLPSIDASFFGPITKKSTGVSARVRNGVLLLGLDFTDDTHSLIGNADNLNDFSLGNDVAGVVHPNAVDVMVEEVRTEVVKGVENDDATLDHFDIRPRNGYFLVTGAASKSTGTVNFSFHVVRDMYHTRPGISFPYLEKPRRVNSRTWPALGFHIEAIETDVDRAWWVVLFGEVIFGILTVGWSISLIESMVSRAAANFTAKVKAGKPRGPAARVQRTIPPPGGIAVRIALDQFEITESGVFIGISVRAMPAAAVLFGPTTVPATYNGDILRYILRPPSGTSRSDPALRIRWILEDRTNNVVLQDLDGPAEGRLQFEFLPSAFPAATHFTVVARLYRLLGTAVVDLGTKSVNVHLRAALPPNAYIRWRWQATNPQITVDEASDTWSYRGELRVTRYSEWHRTDAPCRAVNAPARYRFEVEKADRLPFSLRLLENHRKGLCPYCFYGGPAGISANL